MREGGAALTPPQAHIQCTHSSGSPLSPTAVSLRAHGSCPGGLSSGTFGQGGDGSRTVGGLVGQRLCALCRGSAVPSATVSAPAVWEGPPKSRSTLLKSCSGGQSQERISAGPERGHQPGKAQARGSAPLTLSVPFPTHSRMTPSKQTKV